MPAPVLIVHEDFAFRQMLIEVLREAGYQAAGFDDPLKALDAIEADSQVRVLVTRVDFGEGKLNGPALVRMLRHNAKRDIRVVFVGRPANERHVDALGVFVPHPIDPQVIAEIIARLLSSTLRNSGGEAESLKDSI